MLNLFKNPGARMDANETAFVARELEHVDTEVYKQIYAGLIMRTLLPTKQGIPDWARVYTWKEMNEVGQAKIVANAADDIPLSDVSAVERSKTIKTIAGGYHYDWEELRAAAATGMRLDTERAAVARFAIESEVDEILAYGNTTYGLEGLFTIASGTTAFTPGTKANGGTAWGSLEAPNANGMEVANDLMAIVSNLHEVSHGRFAKFDITLPIAQYTYASQVRVSAFSETTALDFARSKCPFIGNITPVWRLKASLSGGRLARDTIAAYPKDPAIVCGLVPMEYTPLPVQQKNLAWVVPAVSKCGGALARYPFLVSYNNAEI